MVAAGSFGTYLGSMQAAHRCRPFTCSMACFATWLQMCAGDFLPDVDKLLLVVRAVMQLCGADAYIPLVVELFCGGVLGALLHLAQRVVAAQPHAEQEEKIAEYLFHECLISAVEAFGVAVPQARAHPLPPNRLSSQYFS